MQWVFELIGTDGTTTTIEEPIGWEGTELLLKRDPEAHGLFYEFAREIKLYGLGYDIVKSDYDSYGVDANLLCNIYFSCDDTASLDLVFQGKIDSSKINFETGVQGCFALVNCDKIGPLMTFNSRLDQNVNLNSSVGFDGASLASYSKLNFDLPIKPKGIYKVDQNSYTYDFNTAAINWHDTIPLGFGTIPYARDFYFWWPLPDALITDLGGYQPIGMGADQNPSVIPALWIAPEDNNYNIRITIPYIEFKMWAYTNASLVSCSGNPNCGGFRSYTVNMYIDIAGAITLLGSYSDTNCFENKSLPNLDPISAGTYLGAGTLFPSSNRMSIYTGTNVTLSAGDQIKVYAKIHMEGEYDRDVIDQDIDYWSLCKVYKVYTDPGTGLKSLQDVFFISGVTHFVQTNAKAYLINEVLSRIVESVTNDEMRVYSDYFGRTDAQPYVSLSDGCGSLEILTSGVLLRQVPNKPLTLSFKECFQSLTAIHNIGFGIEDDPNRSGYSLIRVEPMEYFYEDSEVLRLDGVNKLTTTTDQNRLISTIKIGYQRYEAEQYTGLDEFNSQREFRVPSKTVIKPIEIISKFVASGYVMEITRQKVYDSNKLIDWRFDNDVFIICVKRNGGNIEVERGVTSSNLVEPSTVYNARISPFRNLMRWAKRLLSQLNSSRITTANPLVYQSGTGKFDAIITVPNDCIIDPAIAPIAENQTADAPWFDGTYPAFLPLFTDQIYKFEYPLTYAQYNTLKANYRQYISFTTGVNSPVYKGYVQLIEYSPVKGLAKFTLMKKYE